MPIHPSQGDPETTVVVNSDFGPFTLDLQRLDVKELIALGKKKPDERDPFSVIAEYLEDITSITRGIGIKILVG